MAITPGRLALSCLAAALAAGSAGAQVPREGRIPDAASPAPRPVPEQARQALRLQAAVTGLRAQRPQLGLDADSDFRLGVAHTDRLGETHGHFQQLYKGVRVWGGDIITHTSPEGTALPPTDALKRDIHLNVTPALGTDEILGIVNQDLHPKGPYAYAPTAELVVYPEQATLVRPHALHRLDDPRLNATDVTRQIVRYVLAYHVHTALENGPEETAHTDYLVDAQTGAILKKWSTLYTASTVGTGKSQYSGTVQINTNSTSSGYELRDMTRGAGGTFGNNVVTNLNHATSGNGSVYSNSTDTWGDGANYNGGSTTSANGQTAAVDAAYGIQCTWDMYKNVLGRDGIDDTGQASYLRVHYSTSYDNAFWDDSCFCMTFGDGSMFKSLESVDVAGHEMSHGVCASAVPGGLTYSGESGGLNEANSDIFGTMVEFYDLGGGEAAHATTIPATGGNWTIGEQLETSSFPTPLRYMYKPSLDGQSPDAWSSSLKNLDVHYSSGPMNRAFYFMSQGASSSASSNYYSSYTPNGFPGVGNDHATRIHYRALTTYYTSSETYAQARNAEISAAKDLYGAGSPEEQAAWNAFAAINVGSPWSGSANTVTASITTPSGNVTLASGATQAFAGTATDSSASATLTYGWNFGDGTTATGATASHTFTNTGSAALTRTVIFTATDNTGVKGTATRTITVNPASAPKNTVTASITTPSGNVTLASGTTQAFAGTATDSSTSATLTYAWNFGDGTTATGATASHIFTNTGSAALTCTVTFTATDSTGVSSSATRTVTVNPASGGGGSTELIKNGGFESGSTGWTQTSGVIGQYGGSEPTHSGTWDAWLDGYGSRHTDYVYQQVAIPSTATSATLSFYLHVDTAETTTTSAYDKLSILVQSTSGTTLKTLGIFSNLNAGSGYTLRTYDLSAYKGKTIRLKFNGVEDSSLQTSFVLDDVSVKVQ